MSVEAVSEGLKVITSAYPTRAQFDADATRVWMVQLSNIPDEVLAQAIQEQIRSNRFPPSIADILDSTSRLSCNGRMSPHDAWAELIRTIKRTPNDTPPGWATPELRRAAEGTLDWGGWRHMETGDIPSHRSRFIQAYESICREIDRELRSPDPRRALNNEAHGQLPPSPLPRDLPPPKSP